jgi:hypothetical protein
MNGCSSAYGLRHSIVPGDDADIAGFIGDLGNQHEELLDIALFATARRQNIYRRNTAPLQEPRGKRLVSRF